MLGLLFAWITASMWHGSNQRVALLRCNGSPGCFDTFWLQNLLSSKKRNLDHWVTVQFFFFLAQVRHFWWCFCFRSGLVALFLKMSERGDSWCTDSSFSSFLVKLSQVFEPALLDSILKLGSSLLLVHIFLPNFFLLVNFAFNMLWYSTPWTATPFSNDPLWLTLFVEGVNDCLLDHCQVSSVPHYCGFKKQEIPTIYTVWMVIYWNSNINILIFWDTDFWLSLSVSVKTKRRLKCFTLHVMILKYMKVALFELFHHIQFIFSNCTSMQVIVYFYFKPQSHSVLFV